MSQWLSLCPALIHFDEMTLLCQFSLDHIVRKAVEQLITASCFLKKNSKPCLDSHVLNIAWMFRRVRAGMAIFHDEC